MFDHLVTGAQIAPPAWKHSASPLDSRLHQLAPYIGKLKPVIARQLLNQFTSPGQLVLDCFSGSGTIALEAVLLGRRVMAFDTNPYAITLTRAKLETPATFDIAYERIIQRVKASERRPMYAEELIPSWVQKFFHPKTLQDALRFADECVAEDDQFSLACLLSILHHQRPGFLSFPSSHLVPYLRDRKFPRDAYPELYEERQMLPRLLSKLQRTFKHEHSIERSNVIAVGEVDVADLSIAGEVDAIITSPPYMNALDYVRDNRLRMWFVDRNTANYSPEPTERRVSFESMTEAFSRNAISRLRRGGHCILIVGETVLRKRRTSHPAEHIYDVLTSQYPELHMTQVIEDEIPDIRRSRRTGAATKRELILVMQKGSSQ